MMNPGDDFGFKSCPSRFRRSNGVGQDIIDTLPLNNSISNDVNGEQGITL